MMIPAFLKNFRQQLQEHKLETVRITAEPIAKGKTLPIKKSKFLGKPFLPANMEYPTNKFGRPLVLLVQINFEEVPPLKSYPKKGILQIFTHDMFWDLGDVYYTYLFHRNIDQPYRKDFSFLTSDLYENLPIYCEHKLRFSTAIEYGGPKDIRFDFDFNGQSFYDFREELSQSKQKEFDQLFCYGGHKIGGYAYFTQEDPRYDSSRKDDLLLLQIDSDKKIMFGDAGISNIFISADDLRKKNFNNAHFNWDCA
jgi:uncharacterized protein YwqG